MEFVIRSRIAVLEPNADVVVDEERGRIVAVVEVAGAEPDSLRVDVDERHLYISGRRREPLRSRNASFAQKEIAYGDFAKRITLPVAVEFDGVAASYADGLLIVALPIAATAYRPTARTELRILVKRTHS